jgi:hypothetical protein
MIYYVLDNACPTLEDAIEVQSLYQAAGMAVDIQTEAEYFASLDTNDSLTHLIRHN